MPETQQMKASEVNPLLRPWQAPFETPPFAEIAPEHFLPAFEQAFADHSAEIAAIEHDPSAADFANTITALERSGKLLSRVSAVFYDLVSAHSNPALLEIDKEVSLRMARHWNPIMMNAVLFGRIAQLHENRATLALTGEEMRLLERTYTRFHRSGAGAMEAGIGALQEAHLLGGQPIAGAVVVQQRDPAEQHRVHHDRIPVPRHPQRHFLVDLQQRRVGVRRHQVVEHRRHLGEQLARALQRGDGVGEVRRGRVVGDGGNLGGMIGERLLEGGQEVFRHDLLKWRRLERRLPGLQQRV